MENKPKSRTAQAPLFPVGKVGARPTGAEYMALVRKRAAALARAARVRRSLKS